MNTFNHNKNHRRDDGDDLEGLRYVKLVRCSTSQQADTSTADQLQLLDAVAADYGMIAAGGDIVLDGITGSIPGARDDIAQLIQRKHEIDDFDAVLVQDVSRLTRSGIQYGNKLKYELAAAGIRLIFADDPMPSASDDDDTDLMQSMSLWSAKKQVKGISQSVARGQMSAILAGKNPHCGRTPYGVDRLFLDPSGTKLHVLRNLPDGRQLKLHPNTGEVLATFAANPEVGASTHYRRQSDERVVLIPGAADQVETVRRMYRRHLLDGWGTYRIAEELNRLGIPSPAGCLWNTASVRMVLNNPTYTGVGLANRYATGIYNIRSPKVPKAVKTPTAALDKHKKPPRRVRPGGSIV